MRFGWLKEDYFSGKQQVLAFLANLLVRKVVLPGPHIPKMDRSFLGDTPKWWFSHWVPLKSQPKGLNCPWPGSAQDTEFLQALAVVGYQCAKVGEGGVGGPTSLFWIFGLLTFWLKSWSRVSPATKRAGGARLGQSQQRYGVPKWFWNDQRSSFQGGFRPGSRGCWGYHWADFCFATGWLKLATGKARLAV